MIKVGEVFGRWTIVAPGGIATRHGSTWVVRCKCGEVRTRRGDNLRSGGTRSCGCLKRDLVAALIQCFRLVRSYQAFRSGGRLKPSTPA
jgi:hypothetical protein